EVRPPGRSAGDLGRLFGLDDPACAVDRAPGAAGDLAMLAVVADRAALAHPSDAAFEREGEVPGARNDQLELLIDEAELPVRDRTSEPRDQVVEPRVEGKGRRCAPRGQGEVERTRDQDAARIAVGGIADDAGAQNQLATGVAPCAVGDLVCDRGEGRTR